MKESFYRTAMLLGNTPAAENVSAYPRVFQINGKLESGAGNVVASWGAAPSSTDPGGTGPGLHWVTATSGDYRTPNMLKWMRDNAVMKAAWDKLPDDKKTGEKFPIGVFYSAAATDYDTAYDAVIERAGGAAK